jgi:hypothetical protein
VLVARTASGVQVTGMVPDGVATVRIGLADGRTVEVPVVANVYTEELRSSTAGVAYDGPNGLVEFPIPFEVR